MGSGIRGLWMGAEMDWTAYARCREADGEQFFVRGSAQAQKAIRICNRCTVREECLDYALENAVDFGVWGGLTERQRRARLRSLAS